MHSVTKLILVLHLLPRAIVGIDLTCESVNPLIPSDVECICKNAPGTDIDWLIDDGFNSNCVLSSICAPQYSGYRYSMNMTENVYKMTINSYNYSDCTKIACKDPSDGSIMRSIVPSSIIFDTTFPTSMTEPGSNNSNGPISVTTGCISGFSGVESDWYIIVDGLEEKYDTSFFNKTDHTSCFNCDTHVNGQRTIGFEHIEASEASGYETKTGRFKVNLHHQPTNLQLTLTSRYYYTVKVNKPSESDGPANNKLRNGLIALDVVFVILVIIVIITLTCVPPKFTKIELHDTKIHLEWTDSLNCCQKIFGYNIVYKPKKGQVRDTCCRKEKTKKKHCTLERLDPMAIYEITLSRTVRCCKSLTANISVITLLSGMPNDQKYHTHSTAIEVKWAKPCCIRKEQILYEVTCNEVKKEITDQTTYTIKDLIPGKMYKVKVFANDNGTNCLMFAEEISTTPIKLTLEDVCYEQRKLCVNCNIKWKVEDFEMPEPSHTLLYNVICYSGKQQVHNTGNLTDSSYTIPKLNLDCSYSIHVYAVYHSVTLEPPGKIELATPYKPTQLKHTAEETEIILEWKKPDHTGKQKLEYDVLLDEVKIITTSETSYRIENLMPGKIYGIKIFTIIKEIKSLPLEKKIRTRPYVIPLDEGQQNNTTLENMEEFREEFGHERAYFSKCELVTETNY